MAGLVAPATLEQIRAASDIVDVIGATLPLKRAGANFVTLCPFHREKSPSFNVNPHRQIFHCFGCHKGGDVFTFIREYENLTFIEAVRRLAERANIPLEFDQQPGQQQARYLKETLLQMHEQITQRWQTALTNEAGGQIARDYLAKRGVTDEAMKLFRLGYAPEAWDDTVNWAKSKNFDLPLVEQAGLIIRKEETDRYYDRFRGRLMFPICDEQGRVIAFSGRILSGDEKTAKYVNSPETPIFSKGRVFFGLDKSKRAILDAGFAIICEGQLDLIACYMAGVKNLVAPQGTAFTPDHARILKRYVDEVVLCFDSDNAGQNAAVRVLDSLLSSGLAIRVATVPAPHDPDSYIKQFGGAAFQEVIKNALNYPDFYLNQLCAKNDLNTDSGRLNVVSEMGELLKKLRSPVLIPTYARKAAEKLGVSMEIVRREFDKYVPTGFGGGSAGVFGPSERSSSDIGARSSDDESETDRKPPPEREIWLMKFLLSGDDHIEWLAQHLDLQWVTHPSIRQVIAACLNAHASHNWQGIPGLLAECQDSAAHSLVTKAVAEDFHCENLEKQIPGNVRTLRNDFLDCEIARLKQRLCEPGIPEVEAFEILRRQAHLRQAKHRPLTPLADEH